VDQVTGAGPVRPGAVAVSAKGRARPTPGRNGPPASKPAVDHVREVARAARDRQVLGAAEDADVRLREDEVRTAARVDLCVIEAPGTFPSIIDILIVDIRENINNPGMERAAVGRIAAQISGHA